MQAAPQGHGAHQGLGQAKTGVARGYDDVAGQDDLEPAPQGHAIDGGDDRLVEVKTLDQAGVAMGRIGGWSARLGGGLQVAAGAEGPVAGAREDADALGVIGGEGVEGGLQLGVHGRVDGVHHLRPVQGDSGDGAARLDPDEVHRFGPACLSRPLPGAALAL